MGKHQEKEGGDGGEAPKKKIVKKIPINKIADADKDELKGWKPNKINKNIQKVEQQAESKKNIAEQFLYSLPKPSKIQSKNSRNKFDYEFDQPQIFKPKPKVQMSKPTLQQIKWDIEDQTFIRKEFEPKEVTQKIVDDQQDERVEQIIDEKGVKRTIRKVDLSKIIDDSWKQEAQRKEATKQLYSTVDGMIDEKSRISKYVKQAQEKAHEIEESLNRRDFQKKQIRNRYGW